MEKLFWSLYIAAALLHASNPRNAEKATMQITGDDPLQKGEIKKKKKVVFYSHLEEAHRYRLELVF